MDSYIEKKLIELKEKYKDNQTLDFDWEQKNGLRFVSDESLELAYEILKNFEISLELKDEKVIIHNNMYSVCDLKNNTSELIDKLKDNPQKMKLGDKKPFTLDKNLTINRICYNCKFQRCPKHLAGYIYYLINKNMLEEKLEDRRKFKEENEVSDYYTFKWNFGNILRYISDEMYEFCYQIAKEEKVYVDRYLVKNETSIKIYCAISCSDIKLLYGDIEKIKKMNNPFKEWSYLTRDPSKAIELCNTYDCRLRGCPIAISGIIHYLIKSGQEEVLTKERQYYKEHKFEMEEELKKLIEKKIDEIETKKNESFEKLKKYENEIENFEDLIISLENRNQRSFHCIVEGEDIDERRKFCENIAEYLCEIRNKDKGKILNKRLQNIAANFCNLTNSDGATKGVVQYYYFYEDRIYIIGSLGEFIKDYKNFEDQIGIHSWDELRIKQLKHVISLLTDLSKENYIILEGTQKEIEEFLAIEPRLQYVYQNFRFKLPEFSINEAFTLYSKHLDNSIFKKLKNNEKEYKEKFIEYVSLNKNFIPFSNRELASYLSIYSNSKGDLVFPDNIYKKETVDEALENIIGLDGVKRKVKEFEKYMMYKIKAEAHGIKLVASNMHMIFTGNPGTGKTTIARIMAKMLYDMGIIKENKLIEVERKDLIAGYIGQTAIKTSEVISKAMGGVLFIDEAYALDGKSSNDYGKEAISTLIKAMEEHKDDLVVIFAGYKNEMKAFLDMNSGITSRIGYVFDFEDYKIEELMKIFYKKLQNMGLECSEKCELEIKRLCSYFSQRKNFGNGRFIDKLIQETILKHAINDNNEINLITEKDIPTIQEMNNSNEPAETTDELLADIIGLENLKAKIKEFEDYVKFIKEAEKNNIIIPNQNMHMIFTGNPGTGKTTIARIMAKILYNTGIIQENKLIEVERKDLIGEYVGKTAPKTYEVIEKAIGGVLFIDEAYSLAQSKGSNDYGKEAISTLIKAMEDHKGEFIVIFAGYKNEMAEFINMNSGIASRIGYVFDFPDYTREELIGILYNIIKKYNFDIEEQAKKKIFEIMNYFCNVENIGNGRFVNKVFQEILIKHAKNKDVDIKTIKECDIPTIKDMTDSLFNGDNMINPDNISDEDLKNTAIHEIGHAFVRYKLFETPGIIKITINAEGRGTLGYVRYKTEEGKYTQGKNYLLNTIKVSLAGMASEEIFNEEFENGNTSDLERATEIARNMVTKWGMSKLGFGRIDDSNGPLAMKVQEEINSILSECYADTKKIIEENKASMSKIIDFLIKEKEITEEQFLEILN